jgi:single-strand DNA-binding protein
MSDLNKVILIGRLTRDAELKYTNSGLAVSRFSIAVNRRKKTGDSWTEETDFFDCVLFGRSAEALGQYMTKGKQIGIEGELHQNRWEQDGQKRSKVEVFVQNIQLLGGGQGGPRSGGAPQRDSQSFNQYPTGGESEPSPDFEDDIPF